MEPEDTKIIIKKQAWIHLGTAIPLNVLIEHITRWVDNPFTDARELWVVVESEDGEQPRLVLEERKHEYR